MHFTYNTILSINTFFYLGALCRKKKGEWSPCTKDCSGEKSRIIYYEQIGRTLKKLQCRRSKAEIRSCNTKRYKCIKAGLEGKLKNGNFIIKQ